MKKLLCLMFFGLFSMTALHAQTLQRKAVELTIYNEDLGVVREYLSLRNQKGVYDISLKDVPALIDPTSVRLKLEGRVIEQNYRFDAANINDTLEKYIGKEITLVGPDTICGTLLDLPHSDEQPSLNRIIIRNTDGELSMLTRIDGYRVIASALPSGFITRPTLQWQIIGKSEGNQDADLSYTTGGIGWHADYVATLDETEKTMNLLTWVTIENKSGASYEKAAVTLVGCDVNRSPKGLFIEKSEINHLERLLNSRGTEPIFLEQEFYQYYEYNLETAVTLNNQEIKRLKFFESKNIPVKKIYYNTSGPEVNIGVTFTNSKEARLGTPLPAGIVKIFGSIGQNSQFIGESHINHAPIDSTIILKIGTTFDIEAENRILSINKMNRNSEEVEYEIIIRNYKDEDVKVEITRYIGMFPKVISASEKYDLDIAKEKLRFTLDVPKGGMNIVTYKVQTGL